MKPYLEDADMTLYQGEALETLRQLPAESVHCVVTSPPYWGLRDYGTASWEGGNPDCDHKMPVGQRQDVGREKVDGFNGPVKAGLADRYYNDLCGKCGARRIDQALGLEATPELYVERMVAVFREVRRVLRGDGVCWVNLGDSYASYAPSHSNTPSKKQRSNPGSVGYDSRKRLSDGLKHKDLVGIPWRVAFALQADGWYLRSDVIWSKPNPMPESVTDRPTKSHEYVFLLTKSPRYFFDQEAVRETSNGTWNSKVGFGGDVKKSMGDPYLRTQGHGTFHPDEEQSGRNVRSVWEIATQPYPEAHFATYPEELVRRCILAGTSERGCCPECGAPWVREVEASGGTIGKSWHNHEDDAGRGQRGGDNGNDAARLYKTYARQVKGWKASCGHVVGLIRPKPVPCTVLDPFGGSGTTALVARKHGRRSILIELSEPYCELAARRLQQLSLLSEVPSG